MTFCSVCASVLLPDSVPLLLATICGIGHHVSVYVAVQWVLAFIRILYLDPVGYQRLTNFSLNFTIWFGTAALLFFAWKGILSTLRERHSSVGNAAANGIVDIFYHDIHTCFMSLMSSLAGMSAILYYGGIVTVVLFLFFATLGGATLLIDEAWIRGKQTRKYVQLFVLALNIHCFPLYIVYRVSEDAEQLEISSNDCIYALAYAIFSGVHLVVSYVSFAMARERWSFADDQALATLRKVERSTSATVSFTRFALVTISVAASLALQLGLVYVSAGSKATLWTCKDETIICRTQDLDATFTYELSQSFDDAGVCVFDRSVDDMLLTCANDYLALISDSENDDLIFDEDEEDDSESDDSDMFAEAEAEAALYAAVFAPANAGNYPDELVLSIDYETWLGRKKKGIYDVSRSLDGIRYKSNVAKLRKYVEYVVEIEVSSRRHSGTTDAISLKIVGSDAHAHISTPWLDLTEAGADLTGSTTGVQRVVFRSASIGALSHAIVRSSGRDGLRLASLNIVGAPPAYQTSEAHQSLFISAYLEGTSGYDKAVAVSNPNCYPVDLGQQGYALWISKNGNEQWPPRDAWKTRIFGVVEPLGTLLFAHPRASAELYGEAGGSLNPLVSQARLKSVLGFNGDDVVALAKVAGSAAIDTMGVPGTRGPWTTSGGGSTQNQCLVRRTASPGAFDGDDWISYDGTVASCMNHLVAFNFDRKSCREGNDARFSTRSMFRCRGSKRAATWNCDTRLDPLAPESASDSSGACPPCDKSPEPPPIVTS
eukprot:g3806.t1